MGLGKLFKPKELPVEYVKALYSAYNWGWTDKQVGKELKSFEEVSESLNAGFREGLRKRKI